MDLDAIQIAFKISHIDSKSLTHKSVIESIKSLKNKDYIQVEACVEVDEE